jgi:8-oxo-dGTP pyrophosphatase MutT (NUDIX family)
MDNKPIKMTISAGGVVVGPDNKIVITSQHGNAWSLPKGHIEGQENRVSRAKIEILEETGILPKNLCLVKKLGWYQRFKIGKGGIGENRNELKTIHIYLFTTKQQDLCPTDKNHPEARWVAIDEVASFLTHPKDKKFFERVKTEIK